MPYPVVASNGTPYGSLVTFRTQSVLPPSAVYVAPGDAVQWEARAPSMSVQATLTLRILTPQGEMKELPQTMTFQTSGTNVQVFQYAPNEGFLISAHVSSAAASRGQCFTRCFLRKNPLASDLTLGHLLFQGYISTDDHLGYPQSRTESSLEGRGWTHTVTLANPTPGHGTGFVVPAGVRWQFKALIFQLSTSGVVAQRSPILIWADGAANQISVNITGTSQPAGVTYSYSCAPNLPVNFNTNQVTIAYPADLVMAAGYQLSLSAFGLQPTDQFQNIAAQVEEWVAQ